MIATGPTYLFSLDDPGCADRHRAGGKAATLAELARAGFAVPYGLVLTVDAFAAAAGGVMPEVVERALIKAADHFGAVPLAVRSSALDEDQPGASRAGQYETVLGVVGADALQDAVQRCWSSAASAGVRAYADHRTASEPARMAVLIQRQLDPTAAGVAFTADPVTGDRDAVTIEAVAGLAATALAGGADPERWQCRTGDSPVLRSASQHAIDAATAGRVAELARRVAADRGAPQDIEWAVDEAGLWLLQARPITALPAIEPVPIPVEVPDGYWEREPVHAPQPHTPMNRSLLNPRRTEAMRKAFARSGVLLETIDFRDIGGWEYVRLVPPGGKDGSTPPGWLLGLLLRVHPALRRKAAAARAEVAQDLPLALTEKWFNELRPRLAERLARLRDTDLAALPDEALARHLTEVRAYADEAIDLHFLLHGTQAEPLYELMAACRDLLGWAEERTCDLLCGLSATSTAPARRLAELAEQVASDRRLRAMLDEGPEALSRMSAADQDFEERLAAYRREDGFRAMRYEVAEAALGERDDLLLQLIRDHLTLDLAVADAAVAQRRDSVRAEARQLLKQRPKADRRRFEAALRRAETVYPVREDNEFYTVGVPLALVRAVCREYGRRLAERDQLAAGDDVFFLELDEMRHALADSADRRELVVRRKGERAWVEAHPGPPVYGTPPGPPPSLRWAPSAIRGVNEAVLWYTGRDFEAARSGGRARSDAQRLDGIAASPGTYTGPVKIVRGETEFDRIHTGDVVVCPVTSPVWSVVFPSMGALITDVGGILSHPAIIARECHIPAVVATGNATELLHDGQLVTVDGSAGTVDLARAAE